MGNDIFTRITKTHSTTFYYASLFFPATIRHDVFVLYAFLRTSDDLVDEKKDKKAYIKFKNQVYKSINSRRTSNDQVIDEFVRLFHKYKFEKKFLDSFFKALDSDLANTVVIKTNKKLQEYIYGVAGVVGLMMGKMMRLPKKAIKASREFGETMQLVNILRDIKEDYLEKRIYLPQENVRKYNLNSIADFQDTKQGEFVNYIRFEVKKVVQQIQKLAPEIENIPAPGRIAIKISRDVYLSIAEKIYRNPLVVWQKRVHVSKPEMAIIILKNTIQSLRS